MFFGSGKFISIYRKQMLKRPDQILCVCRAFNRKNALQKKLHAMERKVEVFY